MSIRHIYKVKIMASTRFALGLALSCCLCAAVHADQGGNLLRNSSFELGTTFNGAPVRLGSEHIRNYLVEQGHCARLPVEGWMIEGGSAEGATLERGKAKSGSSSLRLAPSEGKSLTLISCPEVKVEPGPLVLSAWVNPSSAKLSLEIEFTGQYDRMKGIPRTISKKSVELSKDAKGWTRLEFSAVAPKDAYAVARIKVENGSALIDDVQLESGSGASAFDVRKEDALALSFRGVEAENLPFWIEGDKDAKSWLGSILGASSKRSVEVRNGSFSKLEGDLELWLGPWNNPKAIRFAKEEAFSLEPGKSACFDFETGKLAPDAYVVHAVLLRKGLPSIDGAKDIDPTAHIGGVHSVHMLKARDAIRFGIAPVAEPAKIFGVGNGMLGYGWRELDGNWSSGWPLALFAAAKGEGFACGRSRGAEDDKTYLFAAAGIPFHMMESQEIEDGAPKDAPYIVSGTKNSIDRWNPKGMELILEKARETRPVPPSYPEQLLWPGAARHAYRLGRTGPHDGVSRGRGSPRSRETGPPVPPRPQLPGGGHPRRGREDLPQRAS